MPNAVRAVAHVLVELDEAAGVDEQLDALAGGQLALRVLLLVRRLSASTHGLLVARAEVGDLAGGGGEVGAQSLRSRVHSIGEHPGHFVDGYPTNTSAALVAFAMGRVMPCSGRNRARPFRASSSWPRRARRTTSCARRRPVRDAAAWPHGSVIVTDNQTHGRGRLGRRWLAPTGKTLAISVLLRPELADGSPFPVDAYGWIPLIAGAAMTEAVRRAVDAAFVVDAERDEDDDATGGVEVELKWPNDVLVSGFKICGILSELLPASAGSARRVPSSWVPGSTSRSTSTTCRRSRRRRCSWRPAASPTPTRSSPTTSPASSNCSARSARLGRMPRRAASTGA